MYMRTLCLALLLVATPSFAQTKVTKDDCPKLRKHLEDLHAQHTALGEALKQLEADRKTTAALASGLNEYASTYFQEFEEFKKRWTAAKCINYFNPTCSVAGCDKYPIEQEIDRWWTAKHPIIAEKISAIQTVATQHAQNFLANLAKGNTGLTVPPAVEIPAGVSAEIADVPTPENVDPEWKKVNGGASHQKTQGWKWYDARPNAPVPRNIAQWTKDVDQAYADAKTIGEAVMERCLKEMVTELSAEGNQVCSSEMIAFTKTLDKDDPARARLEDNKSQTYGQRVKYAEMNADAYLTNRVEKSSDGKDKLEIKSKDTLSSTASALRNSSDPKFRCAGMQVLIDALKKGLGRKGKALKSDKVLAGESIDMKAVEDEVTAKSPKDQRECSKS